jgi:hypothetical protein
LHLPLSRGPRSLRVLGALPELTITNITESVTGRKAVEGTVNRILLQLTAGPQERCTNIKYKVTCFSVLVTPNGSTQRLVSREELVSENEGFVDMKNPQFRTPSLVVPGNNAVAIPAPRMFGYELPDGWNLAETGRSFTSKTIPLLMNGNSSFVHVNMYRPVVSECRGVYGEVDDVPANMGDISTCKTDFYINVSYTQERPKKAKRATVSIRRRVKPVMSSAPVMENSEDRSGELNMDDQIEESQTEDVSLEYNGSVVWGQPLSATFRPIRKGCPSGSRHASNNVNGATACSSEQPLVDGECVTTQCSFIADPSVEGLQTEIFAIHYDPSDSTQSEAFMTLQQEPAASEDADTIGQANDPNLLYKPALNDPCRVLSLGSKLSIAYTIQPTMKDPLSLEKVTTTLGHITVDWKPLTLALPKEALSLDDDLGDIIGHGPLRLNTLSSLRFAGPPCLIEKSPFEANISNIPAAPRMNVPFELNYCVKNKTSSHQVVSVDVVDALSEIDCTAGGLLFSGMTEGVLCLGPSEEQTLSYTIIATRAGLVRMPSLKLSSERFKSWIIKEDAKKEVYIFPAERNDDDQQGLQPRHNSISS